MKRYIENKKGFTILEVVISMAVILIVSLTTMTVIKNSISKINSMSDSTIARKIASNSYEAFIYSTSYLTYSEIMDETGDSYSEYSKDSTLEKYYLTYNINSLTLTVTLEYDASDSKAYLITTCKESDDTIVFSYNYNKLLDREVNTNE